MSNRITLSEFEHAHRCPACQQTRRCDVMICRDQREKRCWDCVVRGAEPGAPR